MKRSTATGKNRKFVIIIFTCVRRKASRMNTLLSAIILLFLYLHIRTEQH